MSYDIYLNIHTGKDYHCIEEVGNYTSNVSGMWFKALGHSLKDLHGIIAKDAIDKLRKAVNYMEDNGSELKQLNPTNKWGDYEGATKYLKTLLEKCEEHPNCIIEISA